VPDTQPRSGPPAGLVSATIVTSVAMGALAARAFRAWRETDPRQRSDPTQALRAFATERLVPRLKPSLLAGVEELHAASDDVFRRIEHVLRMCERDRR
jgi:hypothetical protein